jgi:hypothetical protein
MLVVSIFGYESVGFLGKAKLQIMTVFEVEHKIACPKCYLFYIDVIKSWKEMNMNYCTPLKKYIG